MSFEEVTSAIRKLANDVLKDSTTETVQPSFDLCVYLVHLKFLQLSKKFSAVVTDEKLAELIVRKCVEDLREEIVWVDTLKLQIFWRDKYHRRDEIKKIHHETILNNVLPLMTEISEATLIKTVDKDEMYKKIVIFIIMFAGLGNPTQASIVKETQAALFSIFKNTEMDNFLNLSKPTKEQQLIEFARLITGIRLFNKDCKKGGEGIDDLPLILTEGVRATKERFISFKDQLDKRIDFVIKAFSHVYNFRKGIEPENYVPPPSEYGGKEIEELKRLLAYLRQVESCLKDLLKDLEESVIIVEKLVERLQSTLLQLHDVVRYRVAIATVQVFPLFLQLSNIWVEMQEEVDILSEINNNFVDLTSFVKLPQPTAFELALCSTSVPEAPSDGSEIGDESFEFYPGVKTVNFSSIPDQDYLQYEGFCAWSLATADGLLVTGNVSIGVMYFLKRFYSFSSADAAYKWAKDPKRYIKMVHSVAIGRPELINLLNLYRDLEAAIEEESAVQREQKITKENAQVQTDLHPVESYINRNYTFSEWELKRRAVKLATLTRCVTKSQQTVKRSALRTDVGIQVTPDNNRQTQTRRDGSCNHPKYPAFALGLKNTLPDTT